MHENQTVADRFFQKILDIFVWVAMVALNQVWNILTFGGADRQAG